MATNKKTVSVYADNDLLTALEKFKDSGNYKSLNVAIVAILREKLFGDTSGNMQSTLQNQVSSTLDIESIVNDAVTNAIAPLVARLEALENTRSEATAPANFTQMLTSESEGSSVPKTDRSSIDTLPILDAIEALPTEKPLPDETLREVIAATDKPKSGKRSVKAKAILTRPEALAIAKNFGFNGTGQNLYDWSKAALTAKSDESRLANGEKLAVVGLVATFSADKKPAWTV